MAPIRSSALFLLVLLCVFLCCSWRVVHGRRIMVGGWTEVQDVGCNDDVQELGRFSVDEFNRKQHQEAEARGHGSISDGGDLMFSEVLTAKQQVISGIKYYLFIEAFRDGFRQRFDAIVAVKPWLQSKELLIFSPSSDYRS
uniref:Cystatin domain-containing protein n=1 Tax=Nelumbo nucifera TaxID=4432 RepID=A0A822XR78_NELNU|nr:TPA_asm: hypothetical protein HUJ06_025567 [Nelumbo nucifera]